jgi:glucose-6-phosphate 1-dehydrogenase
MSSSQSHRSVVPVETDNNNNDHEESLDWLDESNATLCIVVVGASGDLAKNKTFPSLLHLYAYGFLPQQTCIYGYARSNMDTKQLREKLRKTVSDLADKETVESFLQLIKYQKGNAYNDLDAYTELAKRMDEFEANGKGDNDKNTSQHNRLFYFAIPPNVFAETAVAIKQTLCERPNNNSGWTRLIVEKPFGRDLKSFEQLNQTMSENFAENDIYRIDHYLGKEMVQNLTVLRFSNIYYERVWNAENVQVPYASSLSSVSLVLA